MIRVRTFLTAAVLSAVASCAAAQQSAGVSIPISADVTPACTLSTPSADAAFANTGPVGTATLTVEVGLQCAAGTRYTVRASGLRDQPATGFRLLSSAATSGVLIYHTYWGRTADRPLAPGQSITEVSDGSTAPKAIYAVLLNAAVSGRWTDTLTLTISY